LWLPEIAFFLYTKKRKIPEEGRRNLYDREIFDHFVGKP